MALSTFPCVPVTDATQEFHRLVVEIRVIGLVVANQCATPPKDTGVVGDRKTV